MSQTGSCLCGGVRYKIEGELRSVVACHCSQCRKQSGHFYAATRAEKKNVTIEGEDGLTWYRASENAERGFCKNCGSALFWQADGSDNISILAGSLDGETGLELDRHIFVDDKGDYYSIDDGSTQFAQND